MSSQSRAWGILGGTFDPIHLAHLQLAECALKELELDKIIFMPAAVPPHKMNKNITDEKHRLQMTKLAAGYNSRFEVSDMELNMKGASYTARTLKILKNRHDRLVFILGADSYMALETWYKPEIIMSNAELACACRDNVTYDILAERSRQYALRYGAVTHILRMPYTHISSTGIRKLIQNGCDASSFLPPKVYNYIRENRLYEKI